jgi:glycosyltransferase involved in cell wall biosynthesis
MKILELTNYSAGGCGVFARVRQEAQLLAGKEHEVRIFSSNIEKGTGKIVPEQDKIGKVKITRFPARKIGGESFMSWRFEKEAIDFKPDVIIAHSYRHLHTTRALCLKNKINCKVILVTHAPFGREQTRGFLGNVFVKFYDRFIGRDSLQDFDKIIAITYWEYLYLVKLGVKQEKIVYIPNGISEDYFSDVKGRRDKSLIYTGRLAPIKNLGVVIRALKHVENIRFKIYGPAEKKYLESLKDIVKENKLEKRVDFDIKNYDKKMHIKELDKKSIFILPSFSEGMPQSLIEAMARKCIVVGSDNKGNADIIKDEENGFLFINDNEKDLARVLEKIRNMSEKELEAMRKNARESVEKFKWKIVVNKIDKLIRSV